MWPVATGLAVLVFGAVGAAYRSWRARLVERQLEARYSTRRGPDGVIIGAEAFMLPGTGDRAVVLFHGYNDSPHTMRAVATALQQAGWTVYVPLLPGHGRSLADFAAARADDWIAAAREAVGEALARHRRVAVGGLSLGGALAMIVAAEQSTVRAAVLFSPFLVQHWRLTLMATAWPLLTVGAKYLTGGATTRSIRDPGARAAFIAYGCSTPRLLREVQRIATRAFAALPAVHQPVWIAQSGDDYRIPPEEAQDAFDTLGSRDKGIQWTTGNGHVITVDYGHRELAAAAVAWLEDRVPAAVAGG
ncbi:MAG: alpha/beta fold hydrolase [Gemmatimonadetes bacterium]|nr:alpha/beta fold hydrolase [Gemmatimonadota bacterium]